MNYRNECPECGNTLSPRARYCGCGWEKSQPNPAVNVDHRCEYRSSDNSCRLFGTVCPFPYGKGPWYCSEHWRLLNDPIRGRDYLLYADEHYQEILDDRMDWREKLYRK